MRSLLCTALFSVAASGAISAGDNVWTSTGPDGGLIRQIVVAPSAPNTLYAVGHGGAWKSVDGGAHWSAARNGITELTLQAVAVDPFNAQVAYVGSVLGGGVFKSADGGATWTPSANGLDITSIKSLAIDPVNTANVYAGTDCCGIYKSGNAGASWTRLTGGLPSSSVSAIVVVPTSPATIYAGTQSQGVHKSIDGGTTWSPASAGLAGGNGGFNTLNTLVVDPAAVNTLYAATNGALFKTVDGGAQWAPSNGALSNPSVLSIVLNPQAPSTLYIGTLSGVQRSGDGGVTFSPANSGVTASVSTLAIDPAVPTRVYGGTEAGVFATSNGGTSWSVANSGLANSTVQALAMDRDTPTTLYAGTGVLGIMKTLDGGATWAASNGGLSTFNGSYDVRALAVDPATPSTVYAGTRAGMYKSVDRGATWSAINHGTLIRNISSIAIDPTAPAAIRVGTFFTGVFVSTNGGDSWSVDNPGLPSTPSVNALAAGNGSVLASTPQNGTFARSPTTWAGLTGLSTLTQLSSIGTLTPGNATLGSVSSSLGLFIPIPYMGGVGYLTGSEPWLLYLIIAVIFTGIPAGLDAKIENVWSPLPLPLGVVAASCPPVKAIVGAPAAGTFYAGAACGVLYGTNNGQQTVAMNNGMPPALQVSALAVTPQGADVYAGTEGGGVFRYTKSGAATPVTVVEYYNQTLDHYFITWVAAEQANLDAGNTPTRWTRTNLSFKAYVAPQTGASPVCRYYIPPNLGDSHFFGRGTQECTATGQNNPSFTLESPDFMQLFLPSVGTCPAGTINVYRVFSNRPDANHRYMTDPAVRAQMVARGWLVEGDGPDAVVMCAPE